MTSDGMNSVRIARLLGPSLVAITITEWMNLGVFIEAIGPSYGPHVYLNGTLLFIAGLAIVRAHNRWVRGWPVLVTFVGWFVMLAGLGRMVAPVSAQQIGHSLIALYASLVVLLAIGVVPPTRSWRAVESLSWSKSGFCWCPNARHLRPSEIP